MSISTSGQSGETGLDLFLYPNEQYFDALRNDIAVAEAGGRILVGTMDLNPNEAMAQEVVTHLCTASNRGVDATLAIDAIMLYGARCRGMVLTPFYRDENLYNRRSDFLHSIEATSRLQTRLINEPVGSFANIFRNRFHIKPGIVNDKVYITGANLDRTDRMDMTVGFEDRQTADWLFETISAVAESGTTEVLGGDKVWQLDGQTQIFLDAGKPNQSTILDEAISLIDAAEERIVLSSQYFPGGVTGDHLVRAYKKGVDVQIMYNDPSCNKLFKLGHKAALVKEKLMRPSKFFEGQLPLGVYLHTKGLASEKAAMIGSHNYLEIGVRLGTAEMTLLRRDTVFARFVQKVLQEQVNTEISVA